MVTAIVSDLHLGSRTSVLATPAVRDRLLDELSRADRVVLLGDLLSLRGGPVAEVMEAAEAFLGGLREAVGDRRVVVVPGNHDHRLLEEPLERRRLSAGAQPLALEEVFEPGCAGLAGAVAQRLSGVDLVLAYPGIWLRGDVYATHGHYVDCHMSVPRLESLCAAGLARASGGLPERAARPDDYEKVLAPLYAFAYARAQANGWAPSDATARVWEIVKDHGRRRLSGDGGWRRPHARVLEGLGAVVAVGALNRAGFGPLRREISTQELGRAGLRAAVEVVRRLGIDAEHVVMGHTHHAGPLGAERSWTTPAGTRLYNAGSWVYDPDLVAGGGADDPYWPGRAILIADHGPPEVRLLLEEPMGVPS